MSGKLHDRWPEAFVSTTDTAVAVSRALHKGFLRRLAPRLYTRNLTDAPEAIIRRHLWPIVAAFVPGALIADRTALENTPGVDGSIFLIADRFRDIILPGIIIKSRKGPPPLESDRPFIGGLRLCSTARAYLENMAVSRPRQGDIGRTLTRQELEVRFDTLLRRGGPEALNRLRDEARGIAPQLGLDDSFAQLDKLVGTFLGTRTVYLESPAGKARQSGQPYDPERLALFETLHRELRAWPPVLRRARLRTEMQTAVLAFYESYFSNFIEGTEFAVDEAADIVFGGRIPDERTEDAHDILGTYRLAADPADSRRVPTTPAELLILLKSRHAAIMAGRPDTKPGHFKNRSNRAGNTVFVTPDLVEGSLRQGFTLYQSLETGFQRAVFMMFMVAEVHPFTDGNGRTARLMMNAELTAAGEERIIIPTVYRNNYLAALKALSQTGHTEALLRTLDFAHKWTAAVDWRDIETTHRELEACHALTDPREADEEGIRLRMPSS